MYDIKVEETDELGVFLVRVPVADMARLRNVGAAAGKDVRGTLEGMLSDAVGMARQVMEATQPEVAKALAALAEAGRR